MMTKKHYFAEKLIIATFPVALFAGCAGSGDIKTLSEQNTPDNTTQSDYVLTQNDLADVSLAYTDANKEASAVDNTRLAETDMENIPSPIESGDDVAPYTPYDPNDTTSSSTLMDTLSANNEYTEALAASAVLPTQNILHFASSKFTVEDVQREIIKQHAEYLLANSDAMLTLSGHSDIQGTPAQNQTLSENRAKAVFEVLLSLGVPADQLNMKGHGAKQPLQNKDNWAENRRVEFEYIDAMVLSAMQ